MYIYALDMPMLLQGTFPVLNPRLSNMLVKHFSSMKAKWKIEKKNV